MDTAVVFGRAYGAASTTFPGEKTPGKSTKPTPKPKKTYKTHKAGLRVHPPAVPCHKKAQQGGQRQPRRAKGTQKGDTRTPKRPQRIPKGGQRAPEASQKAPKSDTKTEKEGMTKTSKQITF